MVQFGEAEVFEGFGFSDGSVKRRIGGCGYVLLNRDGDCLAEGCASVAAKSADSNYAEFEGLLQTLERAKLHRLSTFWVGTDSFELVEHVRKHSARYAGYLTRLSALRESFKFLSVQAIDRALNKRADALARQAIAHVR